MSDEGAPFTFCSNCETKSSESSSDSDFPTPSFTAADLANVQTLVVSGDKFGLE